MGWVNGLFIYSDRTIVGLGGTVAPPKFFQIFFSVYMCVCVCVCVCVLILAICFALCPLNNIIDLFKGYKKIF